MHTEPVPSKHGKLAAKYPWMYGYIYSVPVRRNDAFLLSPRGRRFGFAGSAAAEHDVRVFLNDRVHRTANYRRILCAEHTQMRGACYNNESADLRPNAVEIWSKLRVDEIILSRTPRSRGSERSYVQEGMA